MTIAGTAETTDQWEGRKPHYNNEIPSKPGKGGQGAAKLLITQLSLLAPTCATVEMTCRTTYFGRNGSKTTIAGTAGTTELNI